MTARRENASDCPRVGHGRRTVSGMVKFSFDEDEIKGVVEESIAVGVYGHLATPSASSASTWPGASSTLADDQMTWKVR